MDIQERDITLDAASFQASHQHTWYPGSLKGRASRLAYLPRRELSKLNRNIVSRQRRRRTLIALVFTVLRTRELER